MIRRFAQRKGAVSGIVVCAEQALSTRGAIGRMTVEAGQIIGDGVAWSRTPVAVGRRALRDELIAPLTHGILAWVPILPNAPHRIRLTVGTGRVMPTHDITLADREIRVLFVHAKNRASYESPAWLPLP